MTTSKVTSGTRVSGAPRTTPDMLLRYPGSLEVSGFQVVVERVAGEVLFDESGRDGFWQAAMKIIGQDGEDGTYRFPHPDGGITTVLISTEPAE